MLARHWAGQGHQISIITFDRVTDPVYHALPQEVKLHRLGAKVGVGYRGNLKRLLALRAELVKIEPDILCSFLTKNNLLAALACLGRSTPLIASERNNPERQATHPIWNLALKVAYRRANLIVCQTNAIKRCFPDAVQDRLVMIHNPITGFDRNPEAAVAKKLCAVGRLTPQKGFPLLIEAFSRIADKHPEWTLEIWGEGEIRRKLEAQVEQLGMEQRILLPGVTEQPGDWARDATIFVQSSLYEGFGNALGEALASGLPVVATNCDFGPAEMIHDGYNGTLVENENIAEIASAMSRLIDDRPLRDRYSIAAKEAAKKFDPALILSQWDELIDLVTGPPNVATMMGPPEPEFAAQNEPG